MVYVHAVVRHRPTQRGLTQIVKRRTTANLQKLSSNLPDRGRGVIIEVSYGTGKREELCLDDCIISVKGCFQCVVFTVEGADSLYLMGQFYACGLMFAGKGQAAYF